MCNHKAVSHILVLAAFENIAAHVAVIQTDLDEAQRMLDAVRGYVAAMRNCPAISAGNTRIARRELAILMGERED